MASVRVLPCAITVAAAVVTASWGCDESVSARRRSGEGYLAARARHAAERPAGAVTAATLVQAPAPPFSEGVFPCSECHVAPDLPPNRTRRVLVDAHDDIVLTHDEQHRWCLDCHDADDRDQLHLASGERVPFAQSYTLCGQCHGEKARDWRAGVHGRRTGSWNGRKEYLLCVHCHDPHAPRFAPIAPEPAPRRLTR